MNFGNLPKNIGIIPLWFHDFYKNTFTLIGYSEEYLVLVIPDDCYRNNITPYEKQCTLLDAWYPEGNEWSYLEVLDINTGTTLFKYSKYDKGNKPIDAYELKEYLES